MLGRKRRLDLRRHRLVKNHRVSVRVPLKIDGVRKGRVLTAGVQSDLFGFCKRWWLLVEVFGVGFEVDVRAIASGFRVKVVDFGLVHHLDVRQVLQGW